MSGPATNEEADQLRAGVHALAFDLGDHARRQCRPALAMDRLYEHRKGGLVDQAASLREGPRGPAAGDRQAEASGHGREPIFIEAILDQVGRRQVVIDDILDESAIAGENSQRAVSG